MKKIALLLPTLNAGLLWADLISSVNKQTSKIDNKIIVDSGSTDHTVPLAEKYGFDILSINKQDFDHGLARQILADAAKDCDILIYLTQDCILASPDSLANLIKAFDDPNVGLAYGRQLPRARAGVLESHARLFNYPQQSITKSFQDKEKMGIKTASCSNSFAAYRRSALQDVGGFPLLSIFGEDVIVGGRMLIKGWKIAYVAEATGYHSHDYTIIEEFKRYFDCGVFHRCNDWLLTEFGSASGEGFKYVKSELKTIVTKNPFLIFKMAGSTFAKFFGYKLGLNYKRLPDNLKKAFSMHKSYWDKVKRENASAINGTSLTEQH